jgi:hypothetical protein
MQLTVQPVLQPLDLGDYHEPYRGTCLQVLVNPPVAFLNVRDLLVVDYDRRLRQLIDAQVRGWPKPAGWLARALKVRRAPDPRSVDAQTDEFNKWIVEAWQPALLVWFSKLLSHGTEDTQISAEELEKIYRTDSTLLEWIKNRCMLMIMEYMAGKKKGSLQLSSSLPKPEKPGTPISSP